VFAGCVIDLGLTKTGAWVMTAALDATGGSAHGRVAETANLARTPYRGGGSRAFRHHRDPLRGTRERRELLLSAGGYTYEEIATATTSTYTAVNRRITEGRARLRRV
jgi:hypothetical protein